MCIRDSLWAQRGPEGPRRQAYRDGVPPSGDEGSAGSSDVCHHGPLHRVAIVGAGFGGLSAARALAGQPVEVTIIDQRNCHTFQPLLYEVATAGLDSGDVAYPIRAIFGRADNVTFRFATVTGVDWDRGEILLQDTCLLYTSPSPRDRTRS